MNLALFLFFRFYVENQREITLDIKHNIEASEARATANQKKQQQQKKKITDEAVHKTHRNEGQKIILLILTNLLRSGYAQCASSSLRIAYTGFE